MSTAYQRMAFSDPFWPDDGVSFIHTHTWRNDGYCYSYHYNVVFQLPAINDVVLYAPLPAISRRNICSLELRRGVHCTCREVPSIDDDFRAVYFLDGKAHSFENTWDEACCAPSHLIWELRRGWDDHFSPIQRKQVLVRRRTLYVYFNLLRKAFVEMCRDFGAPFGSRDDWPTMMMRDAQRAEDCFASLWPSKSRKQLLSG